MRIQFITKKTIVILSFTYLAFFLVSKSLCHIKSGSLTNDVFTAAKAVSNSSITQQSPFLHSNQTKSKRPNGRCKNCFAWKLKLVKDVPEGFCAERNGSSVELLIIAVSQFQNREKRDVLRKIYGEDPDYSEHIRLLFAFGWDINGNKKEDDLLLKEYLEHGDILIFDAKIHYRNMFYLNFNTFDWALKRCKNSKYIVKITDDVFLNIPGWLKTFEKFGSTELFDVHFGTCNYGTDHPIRDLKHPFGYSWDVYPFPKYPSYCAGGGLFLSLETAQHVLDELSNLAIVTGADDLNLGSSLRLTGHCVCNIPGTYISYEIKRNPRIQNTFLTHEPKTCKDIKINPFLGLHMHSLPPRRMLSLWKLKHCFVDSYPKSLKCQRRHTCKEDIFHIEPVD